jgi:hypothetical protein
MEQLFRRNLFLCCSPPRYFKKRGIPEVYAFMKEPMFFFAFKHEVLIFNVKNGNHSIVHRHCKLEFQKMRERFQIPIRNGQRCQISYDYKFTTKQPIQKCNLLSCVVYL